MDVQSIINIIAGLGAVLFGFLLNTLWQIVRDLQESDKELTDKVSSLEVHITGNFVTKHDFDKRLDALDAKLDRIYERLDRVAQRQ